jgi:DUF971 family protein
VGGFKENGALMANEKSGAGMPSEEVCPVAIRRDGESAVLIDWSDNTTTRWTASELRKACPCATCHEKRRGAADTKQSKPNMLPVLSAAEARPLLVESMQPVGTYAYSISFTDGHSSGLFTFPILKRIVEPSVSDYSVRE